MLRLVNQVVGWNNPETEPLDDPEAAPENIQIRRQFANTEMARTIDRSREQLMEAHQALRAAAHDFQQTDRNDINAHNTLVAAKQRFFEADRNYNNNGVANGRSDRIADATQNRIATRNNGQFEGGWMGDRLVYARDVLRDLEQGAVNGIELRTAVAGMIDLITDDLQRPVSSDEGTREPGAASPGSENAFEPAASYLSAAHPSSGRENADDEMSDRGST